MLSDHVMLRSKRKLCNVLTRPILVNHNDIMFPEMQQNHSSGTIYEAGIPVTSSSWLTFWDGDHWLHGDNHSGLKTDLFKYHNLATYLNLYNSLNVFPQLQPSLPSIVVTENTKAVAVSKGSVLQQTKRLEQIVQLGSNLATLSSRLDELQSFLICTATFASQCFRDAGSTWPRNMVLSRAV